jgi:signal transduction histidine kinase
MAEIFKQQHQYDSALFYSKKVLSGTGIVTFPAGKQKAASSIAEIYEASNKADSALKYLHLSQQIKDSLYNREKMMAFQNVLLKKNEKEHAVELATSELQNRYRLYFISSALIVLFVFLFINIRNKRIRQMQIIRNSIADDLHDDIGSTLSSISIMNELAKEKSPEALSLLTSIGESTTAIQENMSDIVWTVNPNNDHIKNLLQRMNLFATEITEAKKIRLHFNSDDSLHVFRLTMKQRKNLYLFFKEAINNAVKHSGADKIEVNVYRNNSQIEMIIADNGNGFNMQEIYDGNGMHSLKRRAEELDAIYNITSSLSRGTSVKLNFKIT